MNITFRPPRAFLRTASVPKKVSRDHVAMIHPIARHFPRNLRDRLNMHASRRRLATNLSSLTAATGTVDSTDACVLPDDRNSGVIRDIRGVARSHN